MRDEGANAGRQTVDSSFHSHLFTSSEHVTQDNEKLIIFTCYIFFFFSLPPASLVDPEDIEDLLSECRCLVCLCLRLFVCLLLQKSSLLLLASRVDRWAAKYSSSSSCVRRRVCVVSSTKVVV